MQAAWPPAKRAAILRSVYRSSPGTRKLKAVSGDSPPTNPATRAAVAAGADGLCAYDVSGSAEPVEIGRFSDGELAASRVAVALSLALVVDRGEVDDGLWILDIGQPTQPRRSTRRAPRPYTASHLVIGDERPRRTRRANGDGTDSQERAAMAEKPHALSVALILPLREPGGLVDMSASAGVCW